MDGLLYNQWIDHNNIVGERDRERGGRGERERDVMNRYT